MAKFQRFGRTGTKLHAEQCPVRTRDKRNYYNYLPVITPKGGFPEGSLCKVCHKGLNAKRKYLQEEASDAKKQWTHLYPQFYTAIHGAYKALLRTKPSLLIVPLRGAYPFEKSIRLLASLDRKSSNLPKTLHMKTGRTNGVGTPTNFDRKRKKDFFQERLLKELRTGNHKEITFIDEARSGGSLSMQTQWILETLEQYQKESGTKVKLRCIAIAERTPKCKAYNHLQQEGILTEFSLDRLFTIDSPQFLLPRIVVKKGDTEPHITYRGSKSHETIADLIAALQELHLTKKRN